MKKSKNLNSLGNAIEISIYICDNIAYNNAEHMKMCSDDNMIKEIYLWMTAKANIYAVVL